MNTGPLRPAVATMLTVHGIETPSIQGRQDPRYLALQQCLPFTVLKLEATKTDVGSYATLQQCLPFTVLKRYFK